MGWALQLNGDGGAQLTRWLLCRRSPGWATYPAPHVEPPSYRRRWQPFSGRYLGADQTWRHGKGEKSGSPLAEKREEPASEVNQRYSQLIAMLRAVVIHDFPQTVGVATTLATIDHRVVQPGDIPGKGQPDRGRIRWLIAVVEHTRATRS